MIVIENTDLIQGDATTAAEVDYTIYGLDNNVLTQIADGQLPNAKGTLYTADSTDVVTAIILVNAGAAHNHVNLYLAPAAGTSRRLMAKDLQLEAGYSLHWEGGKVTIISNLGEVVEVTIVADAVLKTDYDVDSILAATADDTPVALTVAEQTLIGRIIGGTIAPLTVAQVKTLLGVAAASGIASLDADTLLVEAIKKIRVCNSAPLNPVEGDVYINSVENAMFIAVE